LLTPRQLVIVIAVCNACSSHATAPPPPAVALPTPPTAIAEAPHDAVARDSLVGRASHVTKLFGGPRHICAIVDSGGVQCWGLNDDGQLGDGTTTNHLVPTAVPGLSIVSDLALGESSTCALLRDGTVTCFGANENGQLGDGTTTPHATPAPVPGLTDVVEIGAGIAHVCARRRDSSVHCWGANEAGELGDGTTSQRESPVRVAELSGAAQLAIGGVHSCVRMIAGDVRCWGSNAMGELGVPKRAWTRSATRPVVTTTVTDIVDLVSGLNHMCARSRAGGVSCWGWNEECQLGFRSTENTNCISGTPCRAAASPLPAVTDVTSLALSALHACALQRDGTVVCWGDDPRSYRPDNSTDSNVPRLCTPTPMPAVTGATQLAVTWGGACALRPDDSIWCWGSNNFGQLGDGTKRAHATPAPVATADDPAVDRAQP
jgi:alpha-tubulin suppressor-like RCC1 family protein